MKAPRLSWTWWIVALLGVAVAARVAFGFPWHATLAALVGVSRPLLVAAILLNFLSPFAKGWGWHLLLDPVARHRFWIAQEANLIGTAVSSVSVGLSGEAARVSLLVQRDAVPVRAAALSVAASRAVEALGLALFLVLAPFLIELPAGLRGLQVGAAVALAAVFFITRLGAWSALAAKLPGPLRAGAAELGAMGMGIRLVAPTGTALLSWAAEWAVYHLTLRATHLPITSAASFTALIAVNLGGLVRLTPGNVGVTQVAMLGALLPFGIAAEQAVAAGLALQAVQILPVLGLALAVVGRAGLRRLMVAETPDLSEVA